MDLGGMESMQVGVELEVDVKVKVEMVVVVVVVVEVDKICTFNRLSRYNLTLLIYECPEYPDPVVIYRGFMCKVVTRQ